MLLLVEGVVYAQVLELLVYVELVLAELGRLLLLLLEGAELVDWLLRTLHLLHPAQRVQLSL